MAAKTCCCGMLGLRTASLAIGALLVTTSSLGVVGFLASLLYLTFCSEDVPFPIPASALGALIALSAVHLVFSSLLVHGARRGRRSLLLTWLIFCGIVVILQVMAVVVNTALMCMGGGTEVDACLLGAGAAWTALLAGCFGVVVRHSIELSALSVKKYAAGGGKGQKVVPPQVMRV